MDKKQQEALNRKRSNETFNSITQKVKPENQNQQHNARSEAVEPKIETGIKSCRQGRNAAPFTKQCQTIISVTKSH
ncbi:hypothetical protein LC724_07000 [Blautia sp. RD014234]|nr:hypothetical protein [Blautia parvula]